MYCPFTIATKEAVIYKIFKKYEKMGHINNNKLVDGYFWYNNEKEDNLLL